MSDSKVCPHKEFTHECIDCLQVQAEELETQLFQTQRLYKEQVDFAQSLIQDVKWLREIVRQEEMFCRLSGDGNIDRADELKAALGERE